MSCKTFWLAWQAYFRGKVDMSWLCCRQGYRDKGGRFRTCSSSAGAAGMHESLRLQVHCPTNPWNSLVCSIPHGQCGFVLALLLSVCQSKVVGSVVAAAVWEMKQQMFSLTPVPMDKPPPPDASPFLYDDNVRVHCKHLCPLVLQSKGMWIRRFMKPLLAAAA